MLQKSLDYAIKKFGRFYRVPEKPSFLRNLKITKFEPWNWAGIVFLKLFLIQNFDSLCKDSERNRGSTLLSSEMYGLSIG